MRELNLPQLRFHRWATYTTLTLITSLSFLPGSFNAILDLQRHSMHLSLIFVALAVNALPITEVLREESSVDYFDPRERGGSLLDHSAGLGEPLNVIALLRNQSVSHPVHIKGHHLRKELSATPHFQWLPELCSSCWLVIIIYFLRPFDHKIEMYLCNPARMDALESTLAENNKQISATAMV